MKFSFFIVYHPHHNSGLISRGLNVGKRTCSRKIYQFLFRPSEYSQYSIDLSRIILLK